LFAAGWLSAMPRKSRSTSQAQPKMISEDDVLELWFPIFDAQTLISIAKEIEDDDDYFDKARVLFNSARAQVDLALEIVEMLLGTGREKEKRRRRSDGDA
jgi:hypothetical protein